MSTPPTPPPPFGYTPGTRTDAAGYDRRAVKARRRMATDQARLQRAQFRAQMRASRRTSVVGPLLLVALGAVLLLLQTGRLHWPDALAWLGRWWPAILIVAGVLMLAEWAYDRQQMSSAGTPSIPRRTLGGGTAALLILLALVGAGIMAAENGSAWARRNLGENFTRGDFGDWQQLFGARSEFTEVLHAPMMPTGSLTIDDPHGDVNVTGSSPDGEVHVTAHQHIYAWQGNDVEARHRAEQVRFSGDRNRLLLAAPSQDQDEVDLTVELPHDAALTVRSLHGDITVDELRGNVDLNARNGDVKLTALRGAVHLISQDDNADITAHSLGGGLAIDGRTGDLNLSDIEGAVTLHGDFFGTTHLERIQGAVHFQSSFTDFACAGIPGELNVEGRSGLNAHRIDGPVTLSTTNRNLTLDELKGAATVSDRNGSITLALAGAAEPVRIFNQNGSIEISVPAEDGFALDARTQNGTIEDDFGLNPLKTGDVSQLQGHLGHGGPAMSVQTTEGDVQIRRSAESNTTAWEDTTPRITRLPVDNTLSSAQVRARVHTR